MADAAEEELDIKLQKIAGDLIADFDRSLPPYLRKPDGAGGSVVRARVRCRETDRLVSLPLTPSLHVQLEPFQELPQLLDPHLSTWLPLLAESYLESLQARHHRPSRATAASARADALLMPLPAGICRLLYTFAKIRGEKVVGGPSSSRGFFF
ncbi:hypothetical protein VTK73DRAFT_6155 [Phialemonium thermophilum]|uniref:Uncharacterized protein n=1 Tax=Phialemonium thermophilum TaxID=223376 RepID=A0ABR3V0K6_9PEZI